MNLELVNILLIIVVHTYFMNKITIWGAILLSSGVFGATSITQEKFEHLEQKIIALESRIGQCENLINAIKNPHDPNQLTPHDPNQLTPHDPNQLTLKITYQITESTMTNKRTVYAFLKQDSLVMFYIDKDEQNGSNYYHAFTFPNQSNALYISDADIGKLLDLTTIQATKSGNTIKIQIPNTSKTLQLTLDENNTVKSASVS